MALPKASDNPFPSVLTVQQGSAPTTPASGNTRIFTKSDGLYIVNDSGTVTGPFAASAGAFRGCRAHNSTTEAITNSANNTLTFDTNDYDTDTLHSTSVNTSRITATHAGYYTFTADVLWSNSSSTGYRAMWFLLNGTTALDRVQVNAATSTFTAQCLSMDYHMNATDYMEVIVFQTSGGNLNVTPNAFSAINNGT